MPGPGGDVVIMRFVIPESLVNIAHIPRFLWRWLTPQTERLRVLDIGSISSSRFHAEIAMPLSEYTMNIFYIIGVIVVVLFIAGFFGLHA
jgi:hypothetical protein